MPSGSKPGERRGGRKKGAPNKRTAAAFELRKEVDRRLMAQVDQIKANAHQGVATALVDSLEELMRRGNARLAELIPRGTPLVHMLEIMHDDTQAPTFRFEAAKAAASYLHSKTAEQPPPEPEGRRLVKIERVIVRHDTVHPDSAGIPAALDAGPLQGRSRWQR